MSKRALLIFTRNPEYGKVKTRLAKTIGSHKALAIYKFLLTHTAKITHNLQVDKFVYYSENIWPEDVWESRCYQKRLQHGDNLGVRMKNAFEEAFNENYEQVVIIGSDNYDIGAAHIEKAFKKLNAHDVVIGPAEDGGYYLLGLNFLITDIFYNKQWGNPTVLQDTLAQLDDYKLHQLQSLNDVDVYEDIAHNPVFEPFLKPLNQ